MQGNKVPAQFLLVGIHVTICATVSVFGACKLYLEIMRCYLTGNIV